MVLPAISNPLPLGPPQPIRNTMVTAGGSERSSKRPRLAGPAAVARQQVPSEDVLGPQGSGAWDDWWGSAEEPNSAYELPDPLHELLEGLNRRHTLLLHR